MQPFPYSSLKSFTSSEATKLNGLGQLLNALQGLGEIENTLVDFFMKRFRVDFSVRRGEVQVSGCKSIVESWGEWNTVIVASLTHSQARVIIRVDNLLCHGFLNKILGGKVQGKSEKKSLSVLEKGALEYVVLLLMKGLEAQLSQNELGLVFEEVYDQKDLWQKLSQKNESVVSIPLEVNLGMAAGVVQLLLPESVLRAKITSGKFQNGLRQKLSNSRMPLKLKVGEVTLQSTDLSSLEKGDILFFDEFSALYSKESISGDCDLLIGDNAGSLLAQIIGDSPDDVRIKLR